MGARGRGATAVIVGMPTTSFPTHDGDPAGAFVLGMARALARRGHRIEVLAPEPDVRGAWTEPAPGVQVEWIPYARPRALQRTFHRAGGPENLGRDPLAWLGAPLFPLALERAMRARVDRWSSIASHWGVPCGWVSSRVAGGRPHVAFFHSGDVHAIGRLPAPLRRAIARTIAGGATSLAFVTPALRDRFAMFLRTPIDAHVIPMGVDPIAAHDRAGARRALRGAGAADSFLLLAMSRLVAVKGLDRAIAAVAGLDGVELAIAGDGPERARLEREAQRLRARVSFLGVVRGDLKARWLAAADALVAPSIVLPSGRTEGAPTAVIEAMSAGVPVIASDAGGLPELVGHAEGGWIAPGARVDRLRDAIGRLASDPALRARLAAGARQRARGASWDAVAPRIDALLAG